MLCGSDDSSGEPLNSSHSRVALVSEYNSADCSPRRRKRKQRATTLRRHVVRSLALGEKRAEGQSGISKTKD